MLYEVITDPSRYRDREEVEKMRALEPLVRYRRFLAERSLWDEAWERELTGELEKWIEQDRITSYNVCYTKLLRSESSIVSVISKYAFAMGKLLSLTDDGGRLIRSAISIAS